MKTLITIILSFTVLLPFSTQKDTITLTVEVDGLKNKNGYVAIGLFDQYSDFPDGEGVQAQYVEANGSSVEVTFEELEPGEYAIAVLHDENGNEEMDYNDYGMPREGFGFSNGAMGQDGPPRFGDASFSVSKDGLKTIDLMYMSY